MSNEFIRKYAKENGVPLWRIAEELGIADTSFSRKLRHELPEEEQRRIISVIDKIPAKHLIELCKSLGPEYRVTRIDFANVIYRDFGNGYDVEFSGIDTESRTAKATASLWKNKYNLIKVVYGIPRQDIGDWCELLHEKTLSFTPGDFDIDGSLKNEPREIQAKEGYR